MRKVRCHKVGLWKTGWRQNASLRFGGADEGVRPYTNESPRSQSGFVGKDFPKAVDPSAQSAVARNEPQEVSHELQRQRPDEVPVSYMGKLVL